MPAWWFPSAHKFHHFFNLHAACNLFRSVWYACYSTCRRHCMQMLSALLALGGIHQSPVVSLTESQRPVMKSFEFLPEASFGILVLSLPASVCPLVREITCCPFKLESSYLDQKCKTLWLRSLLFCVVLLFSTVRSRCVRLCYFIIWCQIPTLATKGISAHKVALVFCSCTSC